MHPQPRYVTAPGVARVAATPESTARRRLRTVEPDAFIVVSSGGTSRELPLFLETRLTDLRGIVTGPMMANAQ